MLSIGDRKFNKRVDYQKGIDTFPTKAKVMIGASILTGLLIALILFIGSVRTAEKIVQLLNP